MMKTLPLLLLIASLLPACGRQQASLSWPYDATSLDFTGIMHTARADIPIQGALQKQGQEMRYAVIIQNGILLGTGCIDPASGRVEIVQHAPAARPVVTRIGKALVLFLEGGVGRHGGDGAWQQTGRHSHFQDKGLEIDLSTQDDTCRDLK